MPSPSTPSPPADAPERFRLNAKTGAALVAGLVAIMLVSGAVSVWASSARPQSAMPPAWTAEPGGSPTAGPHPTLPAATDNRATAPTTSRTTSTPSTTGTPSGKTASTGASKPTLSATMTTLPACKGGDVVTGTSWSVKVPNGWTCFEETATTVQILLAIHDQGMDVISVTVSTAKDAATACGSDLAKQATVVAQPDTIWGGKTAKTAKVTATGIVAQARCVESKGTVYMMVGAPPRGTLDSVVSTMTTVSTAWVWK